MQLQDAIGAMTYGEVDQLAQLKVADTRLWDETLWPDPSKLELISVSGKDVQSYQSITSLERRKVIDLIRQHVLKERSTETSVYVRPSPPADPSVDTVYGRVSAPIHGYSRIAVAFVDLMPTANWMHPCLYVFVDLDNFEYSVIDDTSPPEDMRQFERVESD